MAAPSGVIVAWPSTVGSIPAGWSRVTGIDASYVKGGAAAGATGGATTHTHTASSGHTHGASHVHSLTTGATNSSNNVSEPGAVNVEDAVNHSDHTLSAASSSSPTASADTPAASSTGSNELNRYTVIWIKSAGTDDIAANSIVYWNSSTAPPNHGICDGTGGTPDLRLYFLKGAAAASDGGTKTAQSAHTHTYAHDHAIASHNHGTSGGGGAHTFVGGNVTAATGGAISVSARSHTHVYSGTVASATGTTASDSSASASTSQEPSWYKLHHIQKTGASSDLPTGIIALWDGAAGAIPAGWQACDGTNGTPSLSGKFIKGANGSGELGNTGGSSTATHQHTLTHTHGGGSDTHAGSSLALASDTATSTAITAGGGAVINPHTHAVTIGNASGTTTSAALNLPAGTTAEPVFFTAIFIQLMPTAIADADNNAVNVTEAEAISIGAADAENLRVNVTETETITTLTVAITSPTPDEVLTRGDPTFAWTPVAGQVTYQIRVSTDIDGLDIIYDSGTVISGASSHAMPAGFLLNAGSYYVWVDVTTSDPLEAISDLVHFTTSFATSVNVTGLTLVRIGDQCEDPADTPHFRLRWTQVTPGGGETFVSYDVLRRVFGDTAWTRIAVIEDVATVHYEDFCVVSETQYEWAVIWEADTAGGTLSSDIQPSPPSSSVTYSYAYLHEKDNPETYGVPLESFELTVTPQQEIVFNRAWGRAARTAFIGEGYDHVIQLTTLPQMRREATDRLARLRAIIQRQATAGTVLCLRIGIDKALYWVQVPAAPTQLSQLQWSAQITLQETHFEEAV